MSKKPRYNWWPFAINMVQDFPALRAYIADLPGGGTKDAEAEREYRAVQSAMEETARMPNGKTRLAVVELTEISRSHTIAGAALQLYLSKRTAQRYRWQFLLLVGNRYGLLPDDAYLACCRRDQDGHRKKSESHGAGDGLK